MPETETIIITGDSITIEETEELLDHAEETVTGLILTTAAYCKSRNTSFSDWVQFVGTTIAPTWDLLKGSGAIDMARIIALNLLAGGAEVLSVKGDEKKADVRISWPHQEDLDFLNLSREDVDPFLAVYAPAAKKVGLNYSYMREGDEITLAFAK